MDFSSSGSAIKTENRTNPKMYRRLLIGLDEDDGPGSLPGTADQNTAIRQRQHPLSPSKYVFRQDKIVHPKTDKASW